MKSHISDIYKVCSQVLNIKWWKYMLVFECMSGHSIFISLTYNKSKQVSHMHKFKLWRWLMINFWRLLHKIMHLIHNIVICIMGILYYIISYLDRGCALQPKFFYAGYYKNHRMFYFLIHVVSISGDYVR